MCGRNTLIKNIKILSEEFHIDLSDIEDFNPSYNIAPTHKAPILLKNNKERIVKNMRWGLIPSWAKDLSIGSNMINARSESLLDKTSYQNLINQNRCIIFSDGYYEWKNTNGNKQPYYITSPDKKTLAMAGLWTEWQSNNNEIIYSFTIITTKAQSNLSMIHNRMPVILEENNIEKWISCKENSVSSAQKLLLVTNIDLDHYRVSSFVNSVKNNTQKCIEKIIPSETINIF